MRARLLVSWLALASSRAYAGPLLGSDVAVDPAVRTLAPQDQQEAAIAFGNGTYVAVWRDGDKSTNTGWSIRAARVNTAGVVQPPELVLDTSGTAHAPAVTFDGSRFLVVWEVIGSGTN